MVVNKKNFFFCFLISLVKFVLEYKFVGIINLEMRLIGLILIFENNYFSW